MAEEGREKEEMMMCGRWYVLWRVSRRERRVEREVIFWLASVLVRRAIKEMGSVSCKGQEGKELRASEEEVATNSASNWLGVMMVARGSRDR